MRRIDAHQHFWKLSRGDYGWLTPELGVIHRDFLPSELEPLLEARGISGTVLVQAAPSEAETDFMLSLATASTFIEGVVGWTDFEDGAAPLRIARMAQNGKLKGLRPMIQDIDDDDWMLRPSLEPAFQSLIAHDLAFDALVLPRHLDNLLVLLKRYPGMRAVVDHCAKPQIAAGEFRDWADTIARIAAESGAFCKLSGLVTQAGPGWTIDALRPYAGHVLDVFGPQRVIWGSDWPVCTLAASYEAWCEATDRLLDGCTAPERAAILGGNAISFYRL